MNSTRWTLAIAAAVALAFFTVLVGIPFMTTTLSDGVASYSQGNFSKAYKELKPLADDGEPTAQYMMGEMFRMGQGVKKDPPPKNPNPMGPGNPGPGLSADQGVPMSFLGIGRWQWVSPEPDAPATVEVWKNDQSPVGEPLHLSGGAPVEVDEGHFMGG